MGFGNILAAGKDRLHGRQTSGGIGGLGGGFVDRKRGGQNAGVGVGDAQPFQQALYAAILTPAAMQGVENNRRFYLAQTRSQIAASVKLDHVIPSHPQGFGTFMP